MTDNKIIFACLEHVEVAIDDYVNSEEEAPAMNRTSLEKCSYCEKEAEYKIESHDLDANTK